MGVPNGKSDLSLFVPGTVCPKGRLGAWVRFVNLWGRFLEREYRIRTGDIDLGKVALYQLSYSR